MLTKLKAVGQFGAAALAKKLRFSGLEIEAIGQAEESKQQKGEQRDPDKEAGL